MRKFLTLSLLAVIVASFFMVSSQHGIVAAQDATPSPTPNVDCNPGKVIDTFLKLRKTNDKDKDAATLQGVEDSIEAYKAACAGLAFKGTTQKVVGPFNLAAGNYKVVATTTGYLVAQEKVISGDCSVDSPLGLFNLSSGEGNTGAESTMTSNGCRLTISVSNISAPWTLVFEPLQ